jgi:hypothetical protein
VTFDEPERLLLRLMGNSAEVFNEQFSEFGDLFTVGDLNERLAGLATVLIPAR